MGLWIIPVIVVATVILFVVVIIIITCSIKKNRNACSESEEKSVLGEYLIQKEREERLIQNASKISSLIEWLADAKTRIDELHCKKEQLLADLMRVDEEKQATNCKYEEVQKDIEAAYDKWHKAVQDMTDSESELIQAKACNKTPDKIDDLENKVRLLEGNKDSLHEIIKEKLVLSFALETAIEDCKVEILRLQGEIDETQRGIEALESEITDKEEELKLLQS